MSTPTTAKRRNATMSKKNTKTNKPSNLTRGSASVSPLTSTFQALKERLSSTVMDNSEQYLKDAVAKLIDVASQLTDWSKKNPAKAAVAAVAALTATSFLVATIGRRIGKTPLSGESARSRASSKFKSKKTAGVNKKKAVKAKVRMKKE